MGRGIFFWVWRVRSVTLLLTILLLALGAYVGVAGWREMGFQAQAASLRGRTIVLDAGHGGIDSGATRNGIIEKEIVLTITHYLASELRSAGANVVMTREGDAPPTSGQFTPGKDQRSRVEIANASRADCLISIHANAFPQSQYHGAQVFVDRGASSESLRLGKSIQEALRQATDTDRQLNSGITHYLLKYSRLPAVTVEVGFLSNPGEAGLLVQPDYQRRLATGIFHGVANYFSQG